MSSTLKAVNKRIEKPNILFTIKGQLYDVTHLIKSYKNSPAILIIYDIIDTNLFFQVWNILSERQRETLAAELVPFICSGAHVLQVPTS